MNSLDIFIKALSNVLTNVRGIFVPHLNITNSKWGAIKIVTLELWHIDGDTKNLVSSISASKNIQSDKDKENAIEEVVLTTIENTLKYYGL